MDFQRLRLLGFKSFTDPTEFRIEPGLTGVVGPNGCGKSNILEGLRWVMGAASAKAMRGDGMDDVIFAGSGGRPSRNHAEVSLTIDNADRTAPAQFNGDAVLEVIRRIDRGQGSTYKINGREVRARDVQLRCADASTGAKSPALGRQGQISELINAKPQNRRWSSGRRPKGLRPKARLPKPPSLPPPNPGRPAAAHATHNAEALARPT